MGRDVRHPITGTWMRVAGYDKIDNVLDPNSIDPPENRVVAKHIEAMVNVYGSKNLLPNNAVTQTINGVTFTVNSDGSVTASGTASATAVLNLVSTGITINTPCILSGCPAGGGDDSTYKMDIMRSSPYRAYTDEGNGVLITVPDTYTYVRIVVYPTAGNVNLTFYPMIRDSRITDPTYVPYAMTNRELTENVIVKSSTNFTPASGVTVISGAYVKRIGNLINIHGVFTITPTKDQYNDIADLPIGFYDDKIRYCVFLNATNNIAIRGRIHYKTLQVYPVDATMISNTINVAVNECFVI